MGKIKQKFHFSTFRKVNETLKKIRTGDFSRLIHKTKQATKVACTFFLFNGICKFFERFERKIRCKY